MESGGFGKSNIAAVSGLTERIWLFDKNFYPCGDTQYYNIVGQLEKQSEPVSGRNKLFTWTSSMVHLQGLHCTTGPVSKMIVPISCLNTKKWGNRVQVVVMVMEMP